MAPLCPAQNKDHTAPFNLKKEMELATKNKN
ncbi:hypothetical protein PEDI_37510 [Persicobacter diffluens]|uniref:Uncharacterized protein n=1 Tax=Persicobacter diffluens TaxID=981 RepID=A0AAN4W1K7_9BACT|nr:hypothetical protein PEDI_37510 [Persicobacter diffluens]